MFVLRNGLSHEHGAKELEISIDMLGYYEVLVMCGGEPALKRVQEEVKRMRREPTITDNFGAGDSRANSAAEQAVQALGSRSGS